MNERAWLILADGSVFAGTRFGAHRPAAGEICFTTGMTGYLETLTDPSYSGQIVVQTFPLIGNCGTIAADFEGARPLLAAYVVREMCAGPSNFRSGGALDGWLCGAGVPVLAGVDVRALARVIRERGVMNAALVDELPRDVPAFAAGLSSRPAADLVYRASCAAPYVVNPGGGTHAVVWDFGCKKSLISALASRGCRVSVVPARTTGAEILALRPDGVLLSNGPGDPADCGKIVAGVDLLAGSGLPVFGVCLGHQLLALARGGRTVKMKYGHRGVNQPVRETATGRLFVTSQNHGYAVDAASLPRGARVSFVNVNDGTCEGLEYAGLNAFSVQFHPEGRAGPNEAAFLFDRFVERLKEHRHAAR